MRSTERFQIGEYWLSQRDNSPVWCRTWFEGRQTCRQSLGTRDFEKAKERLAEWYTSRRDLKKEPVDVITVAEILRRYYDEHASKLASAKPAKDAIARWIAHYGEEAVISELTMERQKRFIKWFGEQTGRGGEPLSAGFVHRVIGVGAAALHWAHEEKEYIASVPVIKNVSVDEESKAKYLTIEEMARFVNTADRDTTQHVWWWAVLSINTLGRPSALLDLSRAQLDFSERTINLLPPGRKQNNKFRPIVPMTKTLLPWIRKTEPLLVAYRTKKVARQLKSIRQGFERVRDRAGLPATVTTYSIRRTMSRELRRRKVSPWDIAGMLGHATAGLKTTEGYAEFDPVPDGPAALAIDAYCAELSALLKRPLTLRTSSVLASKTDDR